LILGKVVINSGKISVKRRLTQLAETDYDIFARSFNKWFRRWKIGRINENQFWKKLLKDLGIKKKIGIFKEELSKHYKMNKSVVGVIKRLRSKKIKTALLSNTTREWFLYLEFASQERSLL